MADTASSPRMSASGSSSSSSSPPSSSSSPRTSAAPSPKASPKAPSPNASSPKTAGQTTAPNANGDDALARAEKQKVAGTAKYTAGAFDDAIPLYSSAISLLPPSAPASTRASLFSNRSACHLMLKHYAAALQDAVAAIEADPSFSKAYARASKCYLSMGQYAEARATLQRSPVRPAASELSDIDKYERMQQRAAELVNSNPQLALQFLSQLLIHTPGNVKAQLLQVQAMLATRQLDRAKAALDALYREEPNNVDVLYWRGLCFYTMGNSDLALKHMQMVLRVDPDYSAAARLFKQLRLMDSKKAEGNALFQQGEAKAQEAYDKYTECMQIDPSNTAYAAVILANRAAASMKLRQWDRAIEDCDLSLRYKPDNVKVLLRRAACRKEKGELEESVRDIEAAVKLDSDNDDLKRQLREAKLELKKASRKDYYGILGLDKSSFSESELKKAYRKQALLHHPDKNSQTEESRAKAEAQFKDITEAYETLSDDNKRRRYDSGADLEDDGAGGGMGGMDPSELFSMFFSGAGGGGMGGMGGMGGTGGMPFRSRGGGGHGHSHGGFR